MSPKVTGEILRQTAERLSDKPALIFAGGSMTFGELDRRADRLANALLDLGLERGAKGAIMARNVPAYPTAYFGAARSGHVLVHATTRYTATELAYILNKSDAEALLVEAPFAGIAAEALPQAPNVKHVIHIGDGDGSDLPGAIAFDDLVAAASADAPDVDVDERDHFAITFTGGTTGFPKGAIVDHRARIVSSEASIVGQNMVETDVAAITTPLFHTAGLFVWYQSTVMVGQTAMLIADWSAAAFLDAVRDHGVTSAFLVPTQIIMLLNDPAYDEGLFRRMRKITYGGSPMPPALNDEILERFPELELSANYGQTEACPLTVLRVDQHPDRSASLGRAPAGMEVAVLDEEGNPLPPGEVGEIATRGDHLMAGYYNDPEQTEAFFKGMNDGWGWTGDLAVMDEEGFFSLVDRAKDMYISGGENVYPKEIENVLHSHPAVAECAVFGIPDQTWGEIGAAHICLRAGAKADEQELIEYCSANLARFKRPRVLRLVEELPKTAVGKIQKNVLRDQYL